METTDDVSVYADADVLVVRPYQRERDTASEWPLPATVPHPIHSPAPAGNRWSAGRTAGIL